MVLCCVLFGAGCASTAAGEAVSSSSRTGDEYADGLYTNHDAGFRLTLPRTWLMYESEAKMPADAQRYARVLRENGAEMIFVAESADRKAFMRGIVEPAGLGLSEYFQRIEQANRKELLTSRHELTALNGEPGVRWLYDSQSGGTRLTFLEFQFHRMRNNVRISLWTHASLFAGREQEFEAIMKSFTAGD